MSALDEQNTNMEQWWICYLVTIDHKILPSEANSCSADPEVFQILFKPKFRYRVYKTSPFIPILSQIIPTYTLPSNSYKTHFNIVYSSTSQCSTPSVPFWWAHQNPARISSRHIVPVGQYEMLTCIYTAFGHTERCWRNIIIIQPHKDRKMWKYFPIQCSLFSQEPCILEGSQASPICLPGKSNCRWGWVWGLVEWNWQEKKEILGEEPVPVLLCATHNSLGLIWDRNLALAVTGWSLTPWISARPI